MPDWCVDILQVVLLHLHNVVVLFFLIVCAFEHNPGLCRRCTLHMMDFF